MALRCCGLVAGCLLLYTTTLAADEISDYHPALLDDELYTEGWDQVLLLADGSLLLVQVTMTNVGFGDHHGGVMAVLVDRDGNVRVLKNSRSNGDWEYDESGDRLDIRLANHRITGRHPKYRTSVRNAHGEIQIELVARAEPWSLGRVVNNNDGYHRLTFLAPVLTAGGRYRFNRESDDADGSWREFKDARGYATRYVYSTAIYDLIQSNMRVVSVKDSTWVPLFHFSRDVDGNEAQRFALFKNGQLMYDADDFAVQTTFKPESADPKRRKTPHSYSVNIENPDFSVTGTIRMRKLLLRQDPLDSLKPLVRALVKFLNTPVQYRYLAEYELRLQSGAADLQLSGSAIAGYVVMRKAKTTGTQPTSR